MLEEIILDPEELIHRTGCNQTCESQRNRLHQPQKGAATNYTNSTNCFVEFVKFVANFCEESLRGSLARTGGFTLGPVRK